MTNEEAIKALKRIRDEAINNFVGDWQDYEAFGIALKALADRKTEPQIIACPIQEEDAEYARWLYEGEPQTVDTLAIDMAVAKCKAQHNNCKNCDKKCIWRDGPQIDDLIKQADSLIEFEKELLKTEPQTDIEIARAIVHKAIDDAVIAEDAYPDLRQKMHDAVDNYDPQTEREGE